MGKMVLVDDKGEMLAIGFTKEELELIEKEPGAFKLWVYLNQVN